MRICPGMCISNIGLGDIGVAMLAGAIRNAARWLAERITWCPLFGGSLSSPRASKRQSVDTIVTCKWYLGLNQRLSRDWATHKNIVIWGYTVRSSCNNDNSVILFRHHAGISSLLQCLGWLSQLRSGAIGVTAALGFAVRPIYQRGTLKNHTIVKVL